MTNSTNSVHALVRLLKSPTDPPSIPGPSKIEIACLAWSDPSFGAANKGEVIGEWLLTLLGQAKKSRGANSVSEPIADARYWTLLCGVLTTPLPTAARPIKTWLLPLLNRFQLDTIVIQLLALHSSQVLAPARAALAVLWPLAQKKIGVDALGDCLSAVFDACTEWERIDDDLGWICSTVVGAYRNAQTNAGNKKKLYNSFLTIHLPSWLCTIGTSPTLVSPLSTKQLQDSIYAAGTDTLFSLDALKQPLDTLFSALSSSTPLISSLLPVLPKVFTSFLSATHRHRSALFVSASSAVGGKEEVRKRGMDFIGKCWTLIWGSASLRGHFEVEKWKSVIGVFEIIGKERLFVSHSVRGTHIDATNGEYGGELALSEARDKAVEILETLDVSSNDSRAELVVLSTRLLDVLVQIEYDFVGSVLERILSALINIPPPLSQLVTTPASEFLTHVLEYHTKTRTVHAYAMALLGAVVASSASSTSWTCSSLTMKSTFPLAYHLPALARALHTSLTLTQTTPLAIAVLQAVESAWRAFKDAYQEEERVAKKRRITEDTDKNGHEARLVPAQAQVFSYTGRVAGTVLSNLPANAYTKDEEYSLETLWGDVGKSGWTVIWDCLREKTGKGREHDVMKGRDGKKRKHVVETGPPSTLYPHIVTSAALRFLYDIRARMSFPLGDCDRLGEVHVETLLNVVRDESSDPELVLETIRTLLWHIWYTHHCSQKQMEIQPIFTATLDILTTRPLSKSKWSGVSAALTRDNLGLAALYVLTDRWIDVLDALASTENLERLISMLLAVSLDIPDKDTRENSNEIYLQRDHVAITLRGILFDLLRNAQFWELHKIRAVFLSSVLSLTAPLASYCFPTPGVESHSPATAAAQTELTLACNAYRLFHYVPPEYFTRPVRAELVKRAIAGDVQICTELDRQKSKTKKYMDGSNPSLQGKPHTEETGDGAPPEDSKKWSRRLTFVRVFLQRMGQFLNTSSHSTSLAFVNHLLSSPSCISSPSEALTTATLDLIQLHVVSLLRSPEPEAAASISSVISTLIDAKPFSRPNCQETWTHIVVQSSVLKLIERLTDFDPASLPDLVKRALKTLLEVLESALLPHARRLVERDTTELDGFPSSERINAWSRALSLTRWLGMNFQLALTPYGLKLATSTIRSEISARLNSETYSSILGLLFEELWCMPDVSHRVHLDVLVGFYTVNGGDRGSDIERVMDAHIIQSSKKLSVEDFSHLLDVLAEGIGGSGLRVGQRERLIRLGMVQLHDAPQGTLKVIQNFATRCFNLFAEREEIHGGSSHLKLQYLEFIAKHCSDRPAAIRLVDLGNIWSLLNKILSGSSEHDATTVFPIFHHIVTIIGALIRLRRDLVVHTLPHLSIVLRQLMMLSRKIRPQLGAKQSKIVTDTFPSWLSASQPLSTDEARAFARLLTSLTTKTIPRMHGYGHSPTSTESQKAESLAKPFAKHASYVLVAYVDAYNDPLCIINAEMRRNLEPGLFALCEMVGEHSRDALMVSALDSGGKTILKSLWKEYEKQRYVGTG